MKERFYKGFTLVEMLIVMGILIILMVVGIAAGRFAINRANDVAHQNAADQIYVSLQAFYTDNRRFPIATDEGCGATCTVQDLVGTADTPGLLGEEGYLDVGTWNGGSDATYLYFVGGDANHQAVLVCVSLRGTSADQINRNNDDGIWYCAGNGFNIPPADLTPDTLTAPITTQLIEDISGQAEELNGIAGSEWKDGTWE